ncbi:hypothetical protein MMC30_002727 [Trapelia coarctata]|nr:hypothetical protein [Trapelia coarctata]
MLATSFLVFLSQIFTYPAPTLATTPNEIWIEPICTRSETSIPSPADCSAAIALIPSGTITFSGHISTPLSFHLPPNARAPYYLPAAFRHGSCVVLVACWSSPRGDFGMPEQPPAKAASAMYFTVWPFVRELAGKIQKECLPVKAASWVNGGFAVGASRLTGTFTLMCEVCVRGTPGDWPGVGGRIVMRPGGKVYNVYEIVKVDKGKDGTNLGTPEPKAGRSRAA